jgi:hypothetical protein
MQHSNRKIGFVGSRTFSDPLKVTRKMNVVVAKLMKRYGRFTPVSGGAKGADELSEVVCKHYGLFPVIFKPDWDKYGKSAGFNRNQQIVDKSDMIFAFWDGKSRGTADTIQKAQSQGVPIMIINS